MVDFLKKASSIIKKIFIVVAIYVVVVSLFAHFTSNDRPQNKVDPVAVSRQKIYENLQNPELNKTKEGKQFLTIYQSAMCRLVGEACTDNPSDGDKNYDQSFFGTLAKGITLPYSSPPASGVYWAYSGLENAGFIPKVQAAQGIGFAAIQPISNIWKIFRDAALIIEVLILITIGFLIMFRVKINPQTIITLENALPRIILSLILIVFSFAIAGFLIDLMYVVSAMAILILNRPDTLNHFINGGPGIILGEVFGNPSVWDIGNALLSLLPQALSMLLRGLIIGTTFLVLTQVPFIKKLHGASQGIPFIEGILQIFIAIALTGIFIPIIGNLAGWILSLVILVTTGLMLFFRIFFMLLLAYIRILLNIIFAPIILLLVAIPGKNFFALWLRSLIGDLIVFPITAVLLAVSSTIVNTNVSSAALWQPPFLSSPSQASALTVLVGMGILFLIPDLVKKLKELLGIKPSGVGLGAGIFFGGISGTGRSIMGPLSQFSSLTYGLSSIANLRDEKTGAFNLGNIFRPIGKPPPKS